VIELMRGDKSFDALAGLGILPGKLYNTTSASATTSDEDKNVVAMGRTATMSLVKQSNARLAVNNMKLALQAVQGAYQALTQPAAAATTNPGRTGGTVSADVQRQLANYQTALAAFGGSGS
jgi:hypothetical protein